MARKAQRKSLEWEFARKSGGQYGVSKLRGWRKEFYCEFRWRIFSHGWHEYTTRGCSCLCCTNQTATHPTECTEHTEPSAERDSHRWHGWTQMLGCAGIEQRIKPIERVPAAWDFQQRIEPIERIVQQRRYPASAAVLLHSCYSCYSWQKHIGCERSPTEHTEYTEDDC